MPALNLSSLIEFGREADRLDGAWPVIEQGGFIVPGRDSTLSFSPGREEVSDEHGEETRSAAGARQGSPTEAAASGAPTCPLRSLDLLRGQPAKLRRAESLDLEELYAHYPNTREAYSSSRFQVFAVPVGLFRDLPFRARLALEVPLFDRAALAPLIGQSRLVPDVRAWAIWAGNDIRADTLARSHHQYPDLALCTHLWHEWILGVHPLHEYVAFCVLWLAKALHEHELGFYPGRQHSLAHVRFTRMRPDEFCGCASTKRYRDCHMVADGNMTAFQRWQELQDGRQCYLNELARQGREPYPPAIVPRDSWARN